MKLKEKKGVAATTPLFILFGNKHRLWIEIHTHRFWNILMMSSYNRHNDLINLIIIA